MIKIGEQVICEEDISGAKHEVSPEKTTLFLRGGHTMEFFDAESIFAWTWIQNLVEVTLL